MPRDLAPPFQEGQLVETKSFITGFRGAWFRCKITEISWRKNRVGHVLDYLDFPDERKKWIESYQAPPSSDVSSKKRRERVRSHKKEVEAERQLMLRPVYPPIYRKDELLPPSASSETRVVVEGGWCVGDLVDWLTDGCFWSGKLTQILDKKKAMVELLPQPLGEGQSYEAIMSDLRPTLDWSEESGWTVPTPEGATDFHQRVQIIHPEKQTVADELAASEKPIPCKILIERSVTAVSHADSVQASPQGDDDMETEPESLTNVVANTPETIMKTPKNIKVPVKSDKMNTPKNIEVPVKSDKRETPENANVPLMSDKIKLPKKNAEVLVKSDKRKTPENANVPLMSDKIKLPKKNAEVPVKSDKRKTSENANVPLMSDKIKLPKKNAEVPVKSDKRKTPENANIPLMSDKIKLPKKNAEVPLMSDKIKTPENAEVPLTSDKIKTPENAEVPLTSENAEVPLTSEKIKTPENAEVSLKSDKIKTPENAEVLLMSDNMKTPENAEVPLMSDKIKTPENAEVPLMSDKDDTIEGALMSLEEVANKLTWLKQILMHGYPLPDTASPPWEFVEHRSPSMP